MVNVTETNLEQIKDKLSGMRTNLNKADYLESAFKKDFSIEIKRFILETLAIMYEQDRMYAKAAKAMSAKARFEVVFKDKIEAYIKAADLYCKVGSIEDAEEMFNRAAREANEAQRKEIIKRRKEMYFRSAESLERAGKRSHSMKFYEKLIKIKLEDSEKTTVKEKLAKTYKLLGRFKDAEMILKM